MVAALDAIYIPEISYPELLGLQSYFLEAVRTGRCAPVLITYRLAGRLVALGRYHLYAGPESNREVGIYRRLTGGRIVGAGQGWLGCALILPSRDSLLPQGLPLKPEQVLNRHLRGTLAGLRKLGVDCFYPGRDAITIDRREFAISSFETDSSGAFLLETFLAIDRGLQHLVDDLELLDPDGALTAPMYGADRVTTLARELGRQIAAEDIVKAIEAGHESLLEQVRRRELTDQEGAETKSRGADLAARGWLTSRKRDPTLTLAGRERIQLGFAEAYLALDVTNEIDRIVIAGDLIANSAGLEQFERELRGKPLDLVSVSAAVAKTYADGANYVLGIGDLTNLTRVIMKAS